MVTVTMEQVMNFKNSRDFFNSTNLPLKGAYKLNKVRQSVDKEGDFYAQKFQEIIDQFAKKDESGEYIFSDDGSQILIQEDVIEECNKALENLLSLEVEIDNYGLKLEDLGDDVECTPEELEALMPFFE